GYEKVLEVLLEHGADINATDNQFAQMALFLAAENGHNVLTQLALDKGANINTTSEDKQTALHLAVKNGRRELIKLLLDKGANINARD
ncbi:ankyrin, partial [Glonium stellatum]